MKGLAVTLAVIVGALVGFYGGFHTGKGSTSSSTPAAAVVTNVPTVAPSASGATGAGGGRGAGGGGTGGAGFGRGTAGTVTNPSATGFTVHNPATGADVKVVYDAATQVRKTVAGQVSDIQAGMTVAVGGQAGADGTVTATTITITPAAAPGG